MANKTVLVTGVTGYLGVYVVDAFVKSGWKVRGTVRSLEKATFLREQFAPEQLELVVVRDIVTGEGLEQAMVGVDAVAHTASPYGFTVEDPMKDFIAPSVDGTLAVLKAAKASHHSAAAGVNRIVLTSSFAANVDFGKGGAFRDYTYTEADWNPTTLEDALAPGVPGLVVYVASKTLAEKAAHAYASSHSLILTSLNPPMIYGPPRQPLTSKEGMNTSSSLIYALIEGENGREAPGNLLPLFCNVEDVATAHVRAVEKPAEQVRGKRFLLCGGGFLWEDAIRHLLKSRPALADRLPALPAEQKDLGPIARLDVTPAKEILGLTFQPWQNTVEATVDALLEVEKTFV